MDCLFRPRSVAIIGASHDPTKRGYQAVRALLDAGYAGPIYPVNPRGGELHGIRVCKSLDDMREVPDLALVCTPAASIPEVLESCAARAIPAAVVLALGFAETGSEGKVLEEEVRAVVRRTGIRVVGPNTSGILNLPFGLNLIGARGTRPGRIAVLVQSGNMALSLLNQSASGLHEGVSICVGAGNQVDLEMADYLDYLVKDQHTEAIVMYVESLRDGRSFFEVARSPQRNKPIVVLKGGRSQAGEAAARSHTGALAGEYAVARTAFRQAGIIEVTRTDELFAVAETLVHQPAARGGIAVLSDGGGHATLAIDALSELGVPLASLSPETSARLRDLAGPNASTSNPIDLANAPDAAPRVFIDALTALMADPDVGGVLMVGLFGGYAIRFAAQLAEEENRTARALPEIARAADKPLVVFSLYSGRNSTPLQTLREEEVPVLDSLDVACRCIAASSEWARFRKRVLPPDRRLTAAPDAFNAAFQAGRSALLEPEARGLVARYGVRLAHACVCPTVDDAKRAATHLGMPVVLKLIAASVPHKTDFGAVRLGVTSIDEVERSFAELMRVAPDARGVLVSPQLPKPVAEVLVGARRDPHFGAVLMVGSGGTAVELAGDVALRLAPVSRAEARCVLDETVVGRMLARPRGREAANIDALVDVMLAVSDCILANPELAEIELNPVFVDEHGAIAVDARAFLAEVTA
jgi:acetyltransferase